MKFAAKKNSRWLMVLVTNIVLCALLPAISANAAAPTLTIAATTSFSGLNSKLTTTTFSPTAEIDYLQRSGFHYLDSKGEFTENKTFGSYKILGQRPFRVQFTINSGRVWSDGTPITAVDLLLNHVICSTKYAAAANIGTTVSSPGSAAFDSVCYSTKYADRLATLPTISLDKLSLTLEFDRTFPNWQAAVPSPFPVHALVLTSEGNNKLQNESLSIAAKSRFEKAFFELDSRLLRNYGNIWSNSYKLTNVDSTTNPLLLISNGGYRVTSANSQSVTMDYNERYNSGPAVQGIGKIVFRTFSDINAATEALSRGDIDIYQVSPVIDTINRIKTFSNIKTIGFNQPIYEHIDLRVDKAAGSGAPYSGIFSGESVRARELRKAFLMTIPRDEITEKLIKPINPDAERLDSLFYFPNEFRYRSVVAQSGISEFTKNSQAQRELEALAIVRKYFPGASASNPLAKVNINWGTPSNARRSNTILLIKAAALKAGFDVTAPGAANWSTFLTNSEFDAAVFAWVRQESSFDRSVDLYCTGCGNNYSGYSNTSLDNLVSKIDNNVPTSNEAYSDTLSAERIILESAWSLPLFQHPGVFAINKDLKSFKPVPSTLLMIWNYWDWSLPGAQPFPLYEAKSLTNQASSQNSNPVNHANGWHTIYWGSDALKSGSTIEIEIKPAKIGELPRSPIRWSTSYHLGFCWPKEARYGNGNTCSYIGWGLHSQSGNVWYGNFDFVAWEGAEFGSNLPQDSTCQKRDPSANVPGANYIVCWTGIFIEEDHKYLFKLTSDDARGANWWKASLSDLTTGRVWNVGPIKLQGNDLTKNATQIEYRMSYYGEPKSCENVPIFDTFVSAPKIDGKKLSYSGNQTGSCARAATASNKSSDGDYLMRFGGSNPESRLVATAVLESASGNSSLSAKPTTPTFSGVNFNGNTINIAVNIGSSASSRPDKIYLVAPKLGITSANPLAGKISGSNATWSIDFDKLLSGTMIPLEIVGEKDGVKTEPLVGSYQAPQLIAKNTSAPAPASNFKSRIVGNTAVITANAKIKTGALATKSYIYGKSLGISKSNAIEGDVLGGKVILEIPIKSSMAGKRYPVTIFLSNEAGDSKPLQETLVIPAAPKTPKLPSVNPKPSAPSTVICVRASQTRAFVGTKCPPGWEEM